MSKQISAMMRDEIWQARNIADAYNYNKLNETILHIGKNYNFSEEELIECGVLMPKSSNEE